MLSLLVLLLFAGCNMEDDVLEIFSGKTWKLTYISTENSNKQFDFWGSGDSSQSMTALKQTNTFTVSFEGSEINATTGGTFNAAYACLRQVSFGLLDMAWYTRTTPFEGDVKTYEKQAWAPTQILPDVPEACMSVQFSHIFAGGYSAGYYSYKWAEVLDADAFSLFQEKGIFNTDVASSFRENILSKGGTEHPMKLYKRFRGQEPTIDALLIRNGIKK